MGVIELQDRAAALVRRANTFRTTRNPLKLVFFWSRTAEVWGPPKIKSIQSLSISSHHSIDFLELEQSSL
jgi:hypothetical protein